MSMSMTPFKVNETIDTPMGHATRSTARGEVAEFIRRPPSISGFGALQGIRGHIQ